jgi:hypothetical protein
MTLDLERKLNRESYVIKMKDLAALGGNSSMRIAYFHHETGGGATISQRCGVLVDPTPRSIMTFVVSHCYSLSTITE